MTSDEFIWVDHLEDIVYHCKKLQAFWESKGEVLPNNGSDLEFDYPKSVEVLLYGPTGWVIGYNEEAESWGLTIKGDE